MMNNTMVYQDYVARIEFDARDAIFVGRVVGIVDSITFNGLSVAELTAQFHDAVDQYLAACAATGREPEKPLSGKLVLDLSPDLHAVATNVAEAAGKSLNQWAVEALERSAQFETSLRLAPDGAQRAPLTSG
jgi:predicted HicB family RNase H-like nuclease